MNQTEHQMLWPVNTKRIMKRIAGTIAVNRAARSTISGPDPYNTSTSKRQWEREMQGWRHHLRGTATVESRTPSPPSTPLRAPTPPPPSPSVIETKPTEPSSAAVFDESIREFQAAPLPCEFKPSILDDPDDVEIESMCTDGVKTILDAGVDDQLAPRWAGPLRRMPTPPPPESPPPLRSSATEFIPGAEFWVPCHGTWPPTLVWLGGVPDALLEDWPSNEAWRRFQ